MSRPILPVDPLPCVVLSCIGAVEGDMNVVRSLGAVGIPVILVGEHEAPPASLSRHCCEFIRVPDFARMPERLRDVLETLAQRHGEPLPVIPSADPDLQAMLTLQEQGATCFVPTWPEAALTRTLMDKQAFDRLAVAQALPVPLGFAPETLSEAREASERLRYPAIVKPATPVAWWHQTALPASVRRAKAIRVESADELMALCAQLLPLRAATLVQEFVDGPDEEHFDVHAYIDREGRVQAVFGGRKWRIWPPHAGSGCFVESLDEPALEAQALEILQRIGFRGIANMNFKRDARDGRFVLLEINPRVSQWGILTTRCGVNLPWLAWREACGLSMPPQPLRGQAGRWYVNALKDWHAMRQYRAEGLLGRLAWLRSLLHRPMVCQTFSVSDPWPAMKLTARWIAGKMRSRSRPAPAVTEDAHKTRHR